MTLSMDIGSLSAAYAAGLDPTQVLRGIYERIAETCERPVWLSLVAREDALEALRTAQRRAQAGEVLPLFGIPFAVKDNIDVAGLPTTAACPDFSFVPQLSATVVEKLVAAGAILIGKTNLDQFATGLNGTRSPYGIPSCVFDARYISGGSSSGSAVTVAAGLVSFSLGTDTAGSGRVPAAFNNIVGLKPTKGLLSTRGLVPACRSLDCISIFANTVADALAVTQIAAGFDEEDDFSRRAPADALTPTPLPVPFCFGVPDAAGLEFFGDDAAAALFAESVTRCEALGGVKVEFDLTPFTDAAKLLYAGPWVAERLAAIKDFAARKADAIHPVVRDIILGGAKQSAVDAFAGQYTLAALTRRAEKTWAGMDVMLLPTTPTIYTIEAMLADPVRLNSNLGIYTNFANLMDLSAIAVPAGFRDRGALQSLPFGIMLIGRAFEDGRIGAIADRLHRALDGATLGGSNMTLQNSASTEINVAATAADSVPVAVVGAHLSGQPLNYQLTERGATFLTSTRTAKGYRLYALTGTVPPKPGLMFDGAAAGLIEVEVWAIPAHAFGSFVQECPSPLGIGTIRLEDGSNIKGFICESHALKSARDITNFGSWRNFLNSSESASISARLPRLLQSVRKAIVVALEFRR